VALRGRVLVGILDTFVDSGSAVRPATPRSAASRCRGNRTH